MSETIFFFFTFITLKFFYTIVIVFTCLAEANVLLLVSVVCSSIIHSLMCHAMPINCVLYYNLQLTVKYLGIIIGQGLCLPTFPA